MIEKIRKPAKTKSFVNYVVYTLIFGMIIATFVFMIPGLDGSGGAVNSAAEVGGETISLKEYTEQWDATRKQYVNIFSGEIPPQFEQSLRSGLLQSMVKKEVFYQFADKQRLWASDAEISGAIKDIEAFQEEGRFNFLRYSQYLEATRRSAKNFENLIAKDIVSSKVSDMIEFPLKKSDLEEDLDKKIQSLEFSYKVAEFNKESLAKNVTVEGKEIEDFISGEESKKELLKYYEDHKIKYFTPKKISASYILVKTEEEAQELLKELTPENFSEMAKKHSTDDFSKDKGGDLGYIKRGDFPIDVEDKVYALQNQQISQPIKTDKGVALFLAKEVTPEGYKSFEEVSEEIAKDFLQKKASDAVLENLKEALKNNTAGPLLDKAGIKWSDTKKFNLKNKDLPGIEGSEAAVKTLLSLKEGQVSSDLIAGNLDKFYIVKLEDISTKKTEKDTLTPRSPKDLDSGRALSVLDDLYKSESKNIGIMINENILNRQ